MSETIFKTVDYNLGGLMSDIAMGKIGLPDIQRPFVWKNAKVRDLFDSMYRGYPVGYLLLWENGLEESSKSIGTDSKQLPPSLVIVDGQQRLTSLYATIRNVEVLRKNLDKTRIRIAFNPLEEKFQVADAAIDRDKSFLPDISVLWQNNADLFAVVEGYINDLESNREVSQEERRKIQKAIVKLQGLMSYPFTALQLDADISVEDVSDVFVRINSKGKSLNQADFILTLMSVFWDEGRRNLEAFCRDARQPTKGEASAFNYFIEPEPDQLLRVCVGLGFKRARLQYVYSILRGKDLESGEFSNQRREEQFEVLKQAQAKVLNVQYWQDFLRCIHQAGFRSSSMISSNNNLIFSYILYLIGRTEFKVNADVLRRLISRWYFMSAVTGRFTGTPESAMEYDFSRLRGIKTADEFVNRITHICSVEISNDFWEITLPNRLSSTATRSPVLFAYHAALVLLDSKALFSDMKLADLLDPALHGTKAAIERHHIFPKAYLAKEKNLTGIIETNQIANYAYVEYLDNIKISDQSPVEYVPRLAARFSSTQLSRMYHDHALPENWEHMEYHDFLEKRRELIGAVIREGYTTLLTGKQESGQYEPMDLAAMIETGEGDAIEFKSTLRRNLHTGENDKKMEHAVLKTLAGFMNTSGGTLVVGVADDGSGVGIASDEFQNEDKMHLHLVNLVKERLGMDALTNLHTHFEDHGDVRVMVSRTKKATHPVYLKDNGGEKFYIRTGPSTTELLPSDTQLFIKKRFG